MQIGTVNVYVNKPFAKLYSDIWISKKDEGTATSYILADLGHVGFHILLYQVHKNNVEDSKGYVTIVHEIGHYVFGLVDEYLASRVDGFSPDIIIDDDGYGEFRCTGDTNDPASLMDAGHWDTKRNHRTEWCTPAGNGWSTDHNTEIFTIGEGDEAKKYINKQQAYNKESCWETIVRICRDKYGITLEIPKTEPATALPSGHEDINWNVISGPISSRSVLVLDRSKSMGVNGINLEKLGAHEFVDLAETGEELGIVSFSDGATVNFPLQVIVDNSTKDNAHSKIDKLGIGNLTNIYTGLETALKQIESREEAAGNEIIILISDGINTTGDKDPLDLIPDLIERGVKVYTIGMGGYPNKKLLSRIASATGGFYFYAKNANELRFILRNMSALQTGGDIINTFKDKITALDRIIKSVFVDVFNEEATFMLEWEGSDLDLTLVRPDGTIVDPAAAQTDPNIEYVERDKYEFYRVKEPMAGEWQLIIDAVDVAGEESLAGGVIGKTQEVMFYLETDKDKDYYVYPEKILVQALVAAEDYVANAEVTGTVVRSDGTTVDIILFDDGLEIHGDELANDGLYSNFFSEYAGVESIKEGVYTFNMVVENKEGIQATGNLFEEPPEGWTPEPIAPFTREASVSVYVYEIPPTELALDFPSSVQYSDMLSGKAILTSQGIPLENMLVMFADLLPYELLKTNADGEIYNTPYKVEKAPSLKRIVASFVYGGNNYINTMATQYITIEKENATLTYNGDTFIPAGTDTTLSCQVIQEDDGYPGDITLTSVVAFEVTTDKGFKEIYKANVDPDGVATITAELPEGIYKVATSLSSYYFFAVPAEEITLVVGKTTKKASIVYNGDTVVEAGTPVNLSCKVSEEADGSPGDITLAGPVTFSLTTEEGFSESYTADIDSDGVATTTAELPAGLYKVTATIDSDYYTADPSKEAILAVYDPSGSFVTGGGWLIPEGSSGKVNFSFELKYKKNGTLKGNLMIKDHNSGTDYRATDFTYLVISENKAYFSGNLEIDGGGPCQFTALVEDNGSPGKDIDRFSIDILVDGEYLVFDKMIDSGNIVIHK